MVHDFLAPYFCFVWGRGKIKCFTLRGLLVITEARRLKRNQFLFFPDSSVSSHPRLLQFPQLEFLHHEENTLSNAKRGTNWFAGKRTLLPAAEQAVVLYRVMFSWEPLLEALSLWEKVGNFKYVSDVRFVASREMENVGQTQLVLLRQQVIARLGANFVCSLCFQCDSLSLVKGLGQGC